jgi:hypothetical protein
VVGLVIVTAVVETATAVPAVSTAKAAAPISAEIVLLEI